ncbi:hypothetical protein SUDANB95_07998 (plasmid) [Actinosynnema sp. ALI-1.44]
MASSPQQSVDEINAALDRLRNASSPAEKQAARNAVVQLGSATARTLPPGSDVKAFCDGLTRDIKDAFAS